MAEEQAPISSKAIVDAFRQLSDEHVAKKVSRNREEAWTRLQIRRIVLPRRGRGVRVVAMIAAVSAVAAVALSVLRPVPSPLQYEVRGAQEAEGVIKTTNQPATVAFSDGSVIRAQDHTTVAVSLRGEHGALARLSRGGLTVEVDHRDETDWRFLAGPYEVVVVGTRFDLAWDPDKQALRLALHEGQVHVLGDDIGIRAVHPGDVLQLQAPGADAKPEASSTAGVKEAVEALDPATPLPAGSSDERSSHRSAPPARAPEVAWSRLVADGDFDDVVRAAEAAGLSRVLSTRGATDLKALAQAARYSGRSGVSVQAWNTIRRRFPSSSEAKQAAFFLARTFEQQGRVAEASHWLDVYLSEAPGGIYTAEALGRKLVITSRASGVKAARPFARKYLDQFPAGPYARTARDILRAD